MALRLIEMVLQEKDGAEVRELLKEHKMLEHRQLRLPDGEVLLRILLDAEQNEAVLDLLEKRFTGDEGNRVVILPVEATLPRAEPEPAATSEQPLPEEKPSGRIGREELYEDIKDAARCSRVYLAMVVLSTIVAAIGLYYNSVAIIIGAMVIAPLLGPNMALALGTALGDLSLLRHALLTALAGIGTAMVLSMILGALLQVNPASPEIALRKWNEAGRHRGGLGVGRGGGVGVHVGCVSDADRRDGGGGVVAAAGGVRAAFGRRAHGVGYGRVVTVPAEPDLREPGRRDDISGAGHSPGDLVGERSGAESHAHRHRTLGDAVGCIGRSDPAVAKGLNISRLPCGL